MRRWRAALLAVALAVLVLGGAGFDRWVSATQLPPLELALSRTVLDREGTLLRAYTTADGRWRLPVAAKAVDRGYLAQLLAYEDRRFYRHGGVDLRAMLRAVGQALWRGRIVSGGSTLTMQVARLLEAGGTGSLDGKLRQMRVALALERRLTKAEILGLYLHLAPYGGNIEGVRAASLAWFGREPRRLTPAEAALLVALPQSPEARRPDRDPAAARAARDRALARAARAGVLSADEAAAAMTEEVPTRRIAFPMLAPTLADRLIAGTAEGAVVKTTLDARLQAGLEEMLAARVASLGPRLSAAVIVADHRTGAVLASVGGPDYLDTARAGFLDMTQRVRSPGSTLKPLIYGLAFDAGLAHPETLIEDRPTRFGTYAPQNFDGRYRGTVTVRRALQLSLNVPAVAVLDAVGPAQLVARLSRAGAVPHLPQGRAPGLAVGLGGVGLTLHDLVALYATIAAGGEAAALRETGGSEAAAREPVAGPAARSSLPAPRARVLGPVAAWQVADILAGVAPPAGAPRGTSRGRLAYKTGTSYGNRDAWALGFDGAHVAGVWVGRPDGTPIPGALGADLAAPILFDAFQRLAPDRVPLLPPPAATLTVAGADLPPPLRRFRPQGVLDGSRPDAPQIVFPPDGARLTLDHAQDALTLKVQSGVPPFAWMIDGQPVKTEIFRREALWHPSSRGFSTVSVIDARGAAARARVFIEPSATP